ncbi:MAG TPA: MFS transporter [Gammaproteobacteria bacterium]
MSRAAATFSLGAVIAAACIFGLTYGLSAPLIAQALAARGVGETLIGMNAALYAVGVLAVARWLPRFAERVGLRTGTALALLLVALVLPGFALAALWLWFPLRFLLGAGSEGVFVLSEAWVNQLSSERSRATTIAVYTAALSLGFALGPLVLSAVGAHDVDAYWIGGACAIVALLLILAPGIHVPAFASDARPAGLKSVVRLAPVALAAAALNGALETAGLTFMPIYAMRLGWTAAGANALIATLMIGAIVLQLPIGWLGDRYDRTKLVVALAGLAALGAAIWPLLLRTVPLAYAVIFVWGGVFVGIYTLTVTAIGSRFSGGRLLGMYAGMSIAWGVGALVGPAATGVLMEHVRHGLPVVAAAACAGFTVMVWERGSLVGRARAGRVVGSGPA